MRRECYRCGRCCHFIAVPVNVPKFHDDFENWVIYHGGYLEEYQGKEWLVLPLRCDMLDGDKCSIYEDHVRRPLLCRMYPLPGVWVPHGCAWDKRP